MKIEISEFYKEKGFVQVYVNFNKSSGRMVASLRRPDKTMTSMSYAKYVYTSHYKQDISDGDEVDHINKDKTDDRLENLQVISGANNKNKSKQIKSYTEAVCPICGTKFLIETRCYKTHPNPCCSRRCGGIKSHIRQM